jgi:hypothetical protein
MTTTNGRCGLVPICPNVARRKRGANLHVNSLQDTQFPEFGGSVSVTHRRAD